MNFVLCFILVAYFCFLVVSGRSLQIERDANSGLEVGEDVNHDQGRGGLFSWIKLKPFLRQRIKNMKDVEANKLNPKPVETSSVHSKKGENSINRESKEPTLPAYSEEENVINRVSDEPTLSAYSEEKYTINLESEKPTSLTHSEKENSIHRESEKPTLSAYSEEENAINLESEAPTVLTHSEEENLITLESTESTSSTHLEEEDSSFNLDSAEGNFSTLLEEENVFGENTSSINISGTANATSIRLAETHQNEELISESEFESSTTQVEKVKSNSNLITYGILDNAITGILNASGDTIIFEVLNDNTSATESFDFDETTLLSEGGQIATLQEVSTTIGFELLIDSETKQNLILTELISSQSDLMSGDTEDDFTEGFSTTASSEYSDSSGSDLEETATNQDKSFNPNITEFTIDEIGNRSTDLNSENSFQGDIVAEVSNPDPKEPGCPDAGWCVFWFLTEDMCAKDSHCHGSMKCCMWGCSKMCIDVNDELF